MDCQSSQSVSRPWIGRKASPVHVILQSEWRKKEMNSKYEEGLKVFREMIPDTPLSSHTSDQSRPRHDLLHIYLSYPLD